MTPFPLLPTIGTIPDEQIIGREKDIINLLRLLRTQSVSVEEMRRMGKSMLLLKLSHLCNTSTLPAEFSGENFKAKYFSFQGKQNLAEVIELLINDLKKLKEWYKIDFSVTYNFISGILNTPEAEVGGMKFSLNLPEYKRSWKEIFFKTLDDIADAQEKNKAKLILIFDELPIMLWEWYKEGKYEEAIELLDILRERRQTLEKKGLRFIYCGSIGIKVVLNTFRKDFQYTGEPTNEMVEFDLKPFIKDESDFLCECYILSGFDLVASEKPSCLDLVYKLTNGLPFYIATLFNLLQTEFDYNITTENIRKAYDFIMNEPKQHKSFKQLKDRLEIYYPKEKKDEMIALLSELSKQDDFIEEDRLFDMIDINNKDALKDSLYLLFGDHYLLRDNIAGKRVYKFRYLIFKEWWRINIA